MACVDEDPPAVVQALLAQDGKTALQRFSKTNVPIGRVDGLRVADDFYALTAGDLIHPANLQGDDEYWIGRIFSGAATPSATGISDSTCTDWSGTAEQVTVGFAHSTALLDGERRWFGHTPDSCTNRTMTLPVYCLEE